MTIITKVVTEKKADNKDQPLFVEENVPENSKKDAEAQHLKTDVGGHYFLSRRNVHRIHVRAICLLLLLALMVLIIGVIGGLYTYRQYARTQMHRFRTGWYVFPYDKSNKLTSAKDAVHQSLVADSDLMLDNLMRATEEEAMDVEKNVNNCIRRFFKERFEIDLENEHYEKIEVPDFRDGCQGRFIHDFSVNKTGIIDIDRRRCFVMPLNREVVLPPRNMYDLLGKMYNGFYEVATDIVRETLKVVTPPITDLSSLGSYIASECKHLPTYMLTKVNSSVVKRSISNGVFGQFAGKNIIEFDILNLDDVEEYKKDPQN